MNFKPYLDMGLGVLVAAMALAWYKSGSPFRIDWMQVVFFGGAFMLGHAMRQLYNSHVNIAETGEDNL
jgi:hypothetical protein